MELDVSDKAISKRCKKLDVSKPPRGYWAMVRSGTDHHKALLSLGWQPEDIKELDDKLASSENALRSSGEMSG